MAPSRGDLDIPTQQIQSYVPKDPPRSSLSSLDGHTGPVHVARYNHGAKYCLTGSADRTIRLWNPTLGKEIKKYEGHGREILALDISHDNAKFASSGGDKQVFVWDVASGAITRRLQGHFGKINAVAFNKEATVLCTAGFDAKIMIWDMRAASRDPLQTLKDATNSITSLSIPTHTSNSITSSPEILSSSLDGHVRTHDLRMGKMIEDLVGSPVYSVMASPQSPKDSYLASSGDGKIRIFDRSNGGVLQTFQGHSVGEGRVRAVWGYGEGTVMAGDEDGRVWSWNVLDAKPVNPNPPQIHRKAITWLELSPNGKQMITASLDGTVKVWSKPPKPSITSQLD